MAVDLLPVNVSSLASDLAVFSPGPSVSAVGTGDLSLPWSFSVAGGSGSGTSGVGFSGNKVTLDLQGSATLATSNLNVRSSGGSTVRLEIPDFGEARTTLVFRARLESDSMESDFTFASFTLGSLPGFGGSAPYESQILSEPVTIPISGVGVSRDAPGGATTLDFIAGDTIEVGLLFQVSASGAGTGAAVNLDQKVVLEILAVAPTPPVADADNDGITDLADNCTTVPNGPANSTFGNQTDSDSDGFGDPCDCDLNNDGFCNIDDFNTFLPAFVLGSEEGGAGSDLSGDGFVNIEDFNLFLPGFTTGKPGPAAPTT